MTQMIRYAGILMICLGVTGCNQTSGGQALGVAASLDPTGVSGTALGLAQSVRPEPADDSESGFKLSQIAPALDEIAAGTISRPQFNNPMKGAMAHMAVTQAASIASTLAQGAMTGGVGLAAAAPGLAMRAGSTAVAMGHMAAADAQIDEAMSSAHASRVAAQVVPDEDRPAEAQAVLSIVDGAGGKSASWQNPATGASGKVTIRQASQAQGLTCRVVVREWKGSGGARRGGMVACEQDGRWYDLSS